MKNKTKVVPKVKKETIVDSRSNEGGCDTFPILKFEAGFEITKIMQYFFLSCGTYFLVKLIFLLYNGGELLNLVIPSLE